MFPFSEGPERIADVIHKIQNTPGFYVLLLALALVLAIGAPAPRDYYTPYDVEFDGVGFVWEPGTPGLVTVPPEWRVTFRFEVSSEAPAAVVKKALFLSAPDGGSLNRPLVYLRAGAYNYSLAPTPWSSRPLPGETFAIAAVGMVQSPVIGNDTVKQWTLGFGPELYRAVNASP